MTGWATESAPLLTFESRLAPEVGRISWRRLEERAPKELTSKVDTVHVCAQLHAVGLASSEMFARVAKHVPPRVLRDSMRCVSATAFARTTPVIVKRECRRWLHASSPTAFDRARSQAISSIGGLRRPPNGRKWRTRLPGDAPGLDAGSRNSYQSALGKNCRKRAAGRSGPGRAIDSTTCEW